MAAALADGDTTITDAGELRVKESDRIATMSAELRKMGVAVEESSTGLNIQGLGTAKNKRLKGATCTSYGDHRVAMAMAMAGLNAEGQTTVQDTDCIETSFPGFESKLLELLTKTNWGL